MVKRIFVSSPKSIYALIRISYNSYIPVRCYEFYKLKLKLIGILELIHEERFEPVLEVPAHLRPAQECRGEKQQVLEVERSPLALCVAICADEAAARAAADALIQNSDLTFVAACKTL